MRPPSPIGQALVAVRDEMFAGNTTRMAKAMGVGRSTLNEWFTHDGPKISSLRHRQAIADVMLTDLGRVDTLICRGMGYRVVQVPPQAVSLAVNAADLDPDDIASLNREVFKMRRRDVELRKGRRAKNAPAP